MKIILALTVLIFGLIVTVQGQISSQTAPLGTPDLKGMSLSPRTSLTPSALFTMLEIPDLNFIMPTSKAIEEIKVWQAEVEVEGRKNNLMVPMSLLQRVSLKTVRDHLGNSDKTTTEIIENSFTPSGEHVTLTVLWYGPVGLLFEESEASLKQNDAATVFAITYIPQKK